MTWRSTQENTRGTNLTSVAFVERNLCRLAPIGSTLDATIIIMTIAGWVTGCAYEGSYRGNALQMPGA